MTHLIVFDIDGTLVESSDFDGPLYAQAVESVLGTKIETNWALYQNVTDSGVLEEVLSDLRIVEGRYRIHDSVEATFVQLVGDYFREHKGVVAEIPGARAFAERLTAHPEVAVGFATGGWRETAIMKLNGIGLQVDAENLASASDSASRTEIMQLAEHRVLKGTVARKRTYFGDRSWDVKASTDLGFDFVAIGERLDCRPQYANFLNDDEIMSMLGLTG